MEKEKILMVENMGQYDVIPFFLKEISEGFEQCGYEIEYLDIDVSSYKELSELPYEEYAFIFSINAIAFDGMSLFAPASVPLFAYTVDFPIYHEERLKNVSTSLLSSYMDRNGLKYANKYLLNVNKNLFIPHGGSVADRLIPYEERQYRVVMLGGYEDYREIIQKMSELPEQYRVMNEEVLKKLLSDENMCWEQAVKSVCEQYQLSSKPLELEEWMQNTRLADRCFRMYCREQAVRALIEGEIDVDVFGNGWELFQSGNNPYLHMHESVDYKTSLQIMADAKIVVNVSPAHNAGAHERIFSAMRNGAICFTNYSSYLVESGLEKNVVMYSIHAMKELPELVRMLEEKSEEAKAIAEEGRLIAENGHTWKNRAEDILKAVSEYKAEYPHLFEQRKTDTFGIFCALLRDIDSRLLLEKMKCCVHHFLPGENGIMRSAIDSYNRYRYWGTILTEEGDYQLLENRVSVLKNRIEELEWCYKNLADNRSKQTFYYILKNWTNYVWVCLDTITERMYAQYFDKDFVTCDENEVFVDVGAYIGDTTISYIKNWGTYKKIYCYEADAANMEKCKKTTQSYENIEYRQCAVGEEKKKVFWQVSEDSSACGVVENGENAIEMVSLDEDIKDRITFIKMDIEGGEKNALLGAKHHIKNEHPKLAISVYHTNDDIWEIQKMIYEMEPGYQFYLRYYGGITYPSEYILYAIYKDTVKEKED